MLAANTLYEMGVRGAHSVRVAFLKVLTRAGVLLKGWKANTFVVTTLLRGSKLELLTPFLVV